MITRQFDSVAELQHAYGVLRGNWKLALPTALASLATVLFLTSVVAVTALSAVGAGALSGHPGGMAALLGAGSLTFVAGLVLVLLIVAVAHATVIAAAQDAWLGQAVDLARGLRRALDKLPDIIIASIILAVLAMICVPFILALGLGLLLLLGLGFCMMYVLPAIIVGQETGVSALGASWRLATANVAPSIVAFLGMLLAYVAATVVNGIIGHIPVIGWIAAFFVGGLTSAFGALVAVRFYDLLRGTAQPSSPIDAGQAR
ncbi:MAG: hypothetical protein M3T49_08420 [Candidatus Eremiobacteraeota bacterium]|nr:hypothetical protein [Candidatus Eremiobacteraeota bacterium]